MTGKCQAGYFCKSSSFSATPAVNLTKVDKDELILFGICPRGYFCVEGTSQPEPCPAGYYLDSEGGSSNNSCIMCKAGSYCPTAGLKLPTGFCDQGYYCPSGSLSEKSVICPAGHYCPKGSSHPFSCPAGTFASEEGSYICILCDEGFYCP